MLNDRFLRLDDVRLKSGYSRSSIYQKIKEQHFPAPIKLSPDGRAVGWLESEVDAWLAQRVQASRTNHCKLSTITESATQKEVYNA